MTWIDAPVAPPPAQHRLLGGFLATRRTAGLGEHLARYGPMPWAVVTGGALVDLVENSGLRGRGGAGFPVGRKLAAVAARVRPRGPRAVVLVNACEGERLSRKDHALLEVAPHLVLDGAVLAAVAVGADEVMICAHRGDPVVARLNAAIAERRDDPVVVRTIEVPARYVASEESALVNFINTGTARPTTKPPRPFERGVRGRPTLISNAETWAHLAQIARFGPAWFRARGTMDSPGTTLVTLGGAVHRPGVYEVDLGVRLDEALACGGGVAMHSQAVLVGGYAGGWLALSRASEIALSPSELRAAGAALGVASLTVLPSSACGVAETARIARYLAGESARQCGPCMFGLPAVADDLHTMAHGAGDNRSVLDRIRRRMPQLPGRGACGHPDGFTRLLRSALQTFGDDFRRHAHGRPCRWSHQQSVAVPRIGPSTVDGWQ